MIIPAKLKAGDEIRILALSRSLGGVMQWAGTTEQDIAFAISRLEALGLKVSFGSCVYECNAHLTAAPANRLRDLHEAIADPAVKAIMAVTGGIGAIQILDDIDYELIAAHPKIICGYSDIGYLCNAIFARTGVVTYYGTHFTNFMMRQGADYTIAHFQKCLFDNAPFELKPSAQWSDDAWHKDQEHRTFHPNEGWWCIQPGEAAGTLIGGSYWSLNMLQGSKFFPPLRDAILFLEHPAEGKPTLMNLDAGLHALSFQPEFSGVRAIVIGRFAQNAGITREKLRELLLQNPALRRLPIIANCDFGHTTPIATLPVGGRCQLRASEQETAITITDH